MLRKVFFAWLPLACLLTLVCLLGYALVQQDLRQSANDPQIQMAEDGVSPQSLPTVDISKSLAPFVIVFDENGRPVSSSGTLNGAIPVVPAGVFQYVQMSGEDRFTWEPTSGVRIAAIVDKTDSGFILAGRSLREVEKREDPTSIIALSTWILGMVGLFVVEIVVTAFA